MEHPLESIILINREEFIVSKENDCCIGCAFYKPELDSINARYCRTFEKELGECASALRTDSQGIIFIRTDDIHEEISKLEIKGRPLGSIFQVENEFIIVVAKETCVGCCFYTLTPNGMYKCSSDKEMSGSCAASLRDPPISVIFKNVEDYGDNT